MRSSVRISEACAPAKIVLFGEHFVVYGAPALLCCIERQVTARVRQNDDDMIRIDSEFGNIELKKGAPAPSALAPIIHMARGAGSGLDIEIKSDIPPGVGLGSSSACCVAVAGAIIGLSGEPEQRDVLDMALDAERTVFPDASGADSAACVYGGLMEYSKDAGRKPLETTSLQVVIANSMEKHDTASVVGTVAQFRRDNPKRFDELLLKPRDMISRAMPMLYEGDMAGFGRIISENQKYLAEIGVSNKRLDSIINVANRTCHGSKITGAGGGGCIIGILERGRAEEALSDLRDMGCECFAASISHCGLVMMDTF